MSYLVTENGDAILFGTEGGGTARISVEAAPPGPVTFSYVGSGGVTVGGAATTELVEVFTYVGSGGVTVGGAATTRLRGDATETLFDHADDLQRAVQVVQVPSGNGGSPAAGSYDDAFYGTSGGADADMIWLRSGISGFTPTTYAQMNSLRNSYIVLHPRWRLQIEHIGQHNLPGFDYEWEYILDDQVLVHMPADEAYSWDDVQTVLPADWADYIDLPTGAHTTLYTNYFPIYTMTPPWLSYPGGAWVQAANLISVGSPFYYSAHKGLVVAPKPADSRRAFCNAHLLNPTDPAATNNIFNGWGSSTQLWALIQEPGAAASTVVRLGGVSWSGGYFELIHAGITNFVGRHNLSESRSIDQILNDLATATGDDPAAGSYTWSNILQTVDLSGFIPA